MSSPPVRFITLEGPDGGGKTTQARLLADHLASLRYDVKLTREPGGTNIGDQIREVVHTLKNEDMHPHTELLLYSASRAQLVAQVIRPHLEAGGIVISDRFFDSSFAYQGYGRGLDLTALRQITAFATGGLVPDLTVYLDVDVEEGLARRQAAARAGEEWNRLDALAADFHRRVREGYMALMAQEPQRWVSVDASGAEETVQAAIRQAVGARLAKT